MSRIFCTIFLIYTASIGVGAFADGLPTPWPFPWAKECPMAWGDLSGYYKMSSASSRDQIMVKVTNSANGKWKTVKILRLTYRGTVRAVGLSIVGVEDREVRVHMVPMHEKYPEKWVTLKMYHSSPQSGCDNGSLVPILTVSDAPSTTANPSEVDYVLVRVASGNQN